MEKMSFSKALYVLELNRDYTKDDLKKAYRKQAMLWHPDRGKDPSGERFKDIGEAYNILEKYSLVDVNFRPNVIKVDNKTFLIHQQQLINLLSSFIEDISFLSEHEMFDKISFYQNIIVRNVNEYKLLIGDSKSEFELEDLFFRINNICEQNLRMLYEDFIKMYPYVTSFNISVDYDLKLTLFVKQLDKIKKNSLNIIIKKLSKLVNEKYSKYCEYDFIMKKLSEVIENNAIKILKSNKKLENNLIEDIYEEIEIILEKSFDKEVRQIKMMELISASKGLDSVILKNKIEELKNNYDSEDFYDAVDYLMKNVEAVKSNKYLEGIMQSLLVRYSSFVKQLSPLEDEDLMRDALIIYTKATNLLYEVKNGIINYDILSCLYEITFQNLENDQKILDYVLNKSEKFNSGYVYVANRTMSLFAAVYKTDDAYQLRYNDKNGKASTRTIKDSLDLEHKYVSLSKFLANGVFIGQRGRDKLGNLVKVLYSYNNLCLLLNESDEMETAYYSDITLFNKKDIKLDKYKERMLVMELIANQVSLDLPYKENVFGIRTR